MIDILNEMADLLERNIKTSLDNPYISRSYDRTIVKASVPSISNTGNLRNQVKVNVVETPDGIGLVVDFGTAENYAWFVEYGRRPGKGVPLGVLNKWVVQRGLSGLRDKKGRFIKRRSMIYLINRSIKQHGYAGRLFLQNAINMSLEQIEEKFGAAAEQFILDFLDKSGITGTFSGTQDNTQKSAQFSVKLL